MIVNGVTLPDIPSEMLAKYPNALILWSPQEVGSDGYMLFLTKGEIGYLPPSILGTSSPYLMSTNNGFARYMVAYPNNATEWILQAEMENYLMRFELLDTFSPVWANLDIYECTSLNLNTGAFTKGDIWFPNSESPKPTRVSIGRSLVDSYAREVQRLTGTTEQMNAIQIREKLSTVKAGIKIGDTVLPPIPEDVLASYPYAMIGLNSDYNLYLLGVSDTPFAYLPAELTTTGKAFITTVGFRHKFYAYDGSAWVFQNENSTERIYQELNETIGVCWANDDICTITSRTDAQGEITVGTEVYFSERQNFNGVWLPKIPTEAQGYSNFVVIRAILLGTENYMLLGCAGGSLVVNDSSPLDPSMPDVYPNWLYLSKPVVIYDGIVDGEWVYDSEASGTGYQMLPMPMVTAELDGEFMSTDIFWSDHDIMEAVINSTEVPVGTDNLYFPPLPAIDSDRVSIGYDLCNGIVEEVQRLSGESEKMNALHAYWKLTTVV